MKPLVLAAVTAAALSTPALAQQREMPPAAQPLPPSQQQPSAQQSGQDRNSMNAGERRSIAFDKLSETQIRDLQQALSQKGHDVEADGKWGPRTQAALRDFNRSQNIEGDRDLSMQTVSALGLNASSFGSETTGQGGQGGGSGMSPHNQPSGGQGMTR